ncbi:MAG: fructokinase [Cellvibrionaceae bacterium]
MISIGIDLGGSKIEIIALDRQRRECYRKRIPSPQKSYSDTLAALCQLIREAESQLACRASIGVGLPGSIDRHSGKVKNANSTWINGRTLKKDLEERLDRTIKVENDANCFVLSEVLDGAGRDSQSVFGVILGTGCGGGFYHRGQLLTGAMGLGGEWGHNPLPFPLSYFPSKDVEQDLLEFFGQGATVERSEIYRHKPLPTYTTNLLAYSEYPGPLCYCGKRGCLETWISGRGLERDYQRQTQRELSAEAIAAAATSGNERAQMCLNRYCERLAKSLAQVINILDPEKIVLGGGMSNVSLLYEKVPELWKTYIFSDTTTTQLVPAHHGDASGVRGAALL